jgi:hypothetical protein
VKTGRFLFELEPGWALKADNNQWMVCRKQMRKGDITWQPKSYVGSTRAMLMRVIGQKGIRLPPGACIALNALPEKFLDWRDGADQRKAA